MTDRRRPSLRGRRQAAGLGRAEGSPEQSMDPRQSGEDVGPPEATLVDSALYVDGRRVASPGTLADTYRGLHERPGAMAWIGLYRPADAQLLSAAEEFGLHELAVEDAIVAHQRPKLERYGDTLFAVLRAARYLDDVEEVDFGEVHVFMGRNFVVTVRHSESPDLGTVRRWLEDRPDLLRLGPEAVLYAVLDTVVDEYAPVVAGLQHDIDEIETEVFLGEPNVSRRMYELGREVIEFQRAGRPLLGMLRDLTLGFDKYEVDEELRRYLRDVEDHATTVVERVDGFRQMLANIMSVNATLVTQKQNEEMKQLTEVSLAQNEEVRKVSAWGAILFAPTLIGTIYGMNFETMPELRWAAGYPFAIGLMLLVSLTLYVVFKRRDWL
ncbi:magnesium and cobalt transport protein CorA [Yinghuangia soli]|uniref:Magnesium and cobalt transport protein CorA n=1 Tax=Yinghuangia soli TaxID=2908204 RepID=A0AA41PZ09_9ACTN|nr:magnesium and cobalt transport protein CorA [Yinghuangia soli]MCF2527751.1 magnesium and cobalt transport protein CorA [Yinghuangia soli]